MPTRAVFEGYRGDRGSDLRKLKVGSARVWERRNGDGTWHKGLDGERPGLLHEDEVRDAAADGTRTIYWTEGESDAEALRARGEVATTAPHGAGKPVHPYVNALVGAAEVIVLYDRDEIGRADGLVRRDALKARKVPVRMARAATGKDVRDHLEDGLGLEQLVFKTPRGGNNSKRTTTRPLPILTQDSIAQGERNATLMRAGVRARKAGFGEEEVAGFLLGFNAGKCHPPLPEAEVRAIARSVARYEIDVQAADRRLVVTTAADVRVTKPRWLWTGRIALGALTILVGVQGTGKSTLTAYLAARVSRGELAGDVEGEPGGVLIISYEDAIASTIVPRLLAAGADLTRVHVVTAEEGVVGLPDDIPRIAELVRTLRVKLLILDPAVAGIAAGTDTHRDAAVRAVLAPVAAMADEQGIAVVAISHFTKSGPANVLERTSGSLAFTAAARSVLAFALDPDEPDPRSDKRVLAHGKSNLAPLAVSLAMRLVGAEVADANGEPIETSEVVVVGEHHASADSLLARPDPAQREAADEAEDFLREELADGPRRPNNADLRAAAKAAGIEWGRVVRARRRLGIKTVRKGFGAEGGWLWMLPSWEEPTKKPPPKIKVKKTRRQRS